MSAKRLLNAPLTRLSTRDRTPFRAAASMRPVAEEVDTKTGFVVRKTFLRAVCSSPISSLKAGPLWPMMACTWARSTSGWTSVGPGRKNRPKGGTSSEDDGSTSYLLTTCIEHGVVGRVAGPARSRPAE